MRLIKLKVAGFGPFLEEQVIDFRACNQAGLFMVAGPTGSGKTTLLDAIAFALYGETTGAGQGKGEDNGRQATDVRCTACTPTHQTFVELDFEVAGQAYRVRRNPEYQRAALRGDGTTKELAKAEIYELHGDETRLVEGKRKIADVNEFLEQRIGLTAEQFRRVVVIPQGRFREVLLSPPQQRQDLLKRIFGTYLYERFTDLVKERAAAAKRELDEIERRQRMLLADETWASGLPIDEACEHAAQLVKQSEAAKREANASVTRFQTRAAAAVTALTDAKGVNARIAVVNRAQVEHGEARQAMEVLAPQMAELERALLVAAAARAIEDAESAEEDLRQAQEEHRTADLAVAPLREQLGVAEAARATAQQARDTAEADLGTEQGRIEAELPQLAEQAKAAAKRSKTLSDIQARLKEETAQASKAVERERASSTALATAQAALERAQEAQRRNRAGILARELQTGCPCPVCGSNIHPLPAALGDDDVDDAAVEALQGSLSTAQLEASSASRAAGTAKERANGTQAEKARLEDEIRSQATPEVDFAVEVERRTKRLKEIAERRKSLADALRAATKEEATARTKLESARDSASTADGVKVAAEALLAQKVAMRDEEMKSIAELVTSIEDAKASTRDAGWLLQMQTDLAACKTRLDKAVGALDQAREAAGTAIPIDVRPLEADVATWEQKRDEALRKETDAAVELERLRRLAASLDTLVSQSRETEARLRPAHELSRVIVGDTGETRISLHTWVLGAFLDEVLDVASRRMLDMTRGRYELRRMSGQLDGRQESGLNIEVFDSHTGTSRPARTLSGGETFLASLSMALALAEVAGARGGRALDTVFIDEGFGTLDSETLDVAMNVLNRLREAGRTVGLISHVDEMKRRIETGIEVVKDAATGTSRVLQPR